MIALNKSASGYEPKEARELILAGKARGQNQLLPVNPDILDRRPQSIPERNAWFGDLHVHTAYSFDPYAFGTTAMPSDAYRYARGEALDHPARTASQKSDGRPRRPPGNGATRVWLSLISK